MDDNKYFKVFDLGLQNSLVYKADFFMEMVSGFVPLIVQLFIWLNIYRYSDGEINGYTFTEMALYLSFSVIINKIIQTDTHYQIASEIKNGSIGQYLVKPLDHAKYWLCKDLGNRFFGSCVMIIFISLLVILMKDNVETICIIGGVVLFCQGFILCFLINYILALLAFWFNEVAQIFSSLSMVITFCSGGIVPIDFFPAIMKKIMEFLPLYLLVYAPTVTFTNDVSNGFILRCGMLQLFWIAVFVIVANIAWKKGNKKYSAFGG